MLKAKVGYSTLENSFDAGKETAEKGSNGINPKIGLLFNSKEYNQLKYIEGIKTILPDTDIIGCTTRNILVPDGYISNEKGVGELLLFDDEDIVVSCYGIQKKRSARETGREVALKALEKSELDYAPDYFFMSASPTEEEEYLKGIQDVIGRVPCFGGSPPNDEDYSIFYNDIIFKEGVVVSFIYTGKEITNIYNGNYKETNNMGIITKIKDNRTLLEIDGKNALEKYKEWLNLSEEELIEDKIYYKSITNPIGIKDRLGNLTAIRQPLYESNDKSIKFGSNIAEKTAIIKMYSSIEELINSIEKTLNILKSKCPNAKAYLLVMPEGQRFIIGERMNEVYDKIKKIAGKIPYIAVFTSSEYGYTEEDQTNTTANLMLSFTAFE